MNAPLRARDVAAAGSTLQLFALFHLNLAFSSIEEEQRGEVIAKCYWPLLRLAERFGPIGIEATGFTLEEIAKRDPEWIGRARAMIAAGKIELIGSGYSQMIAPLVPAKVTAANLRIGHAVYDALLGVRPTLALVNEQAYSAGLVGLYLDAGYRALAMDWDNPGTAHPGWPAETRYLPQRALGADGRTIGVLWTNTVAFQKLQRFVHRDVEIDAYLDYIRKQQGPARRALCVYASDAEIFDFRPGRYKTEEKLTGDCEWRRMEEAFARLGEAFALVAPSQVLALCDSAQANQSLRLETPAMPIPVKKQRKYNLARWAVTGRDDLAINAACERIYRGMDGADDAAWKELCFLWASDFRTHITDKRWIAFCERLRAAEARFAAPQPPQPTSLDGPAIENRTIAIDTPQLSATLDRRRGLALSRLQLAGHALPAIGGLAHGHFDDIALQADWYTGDCVFEAPGEHKVTDLDWAATRMAKDARGDIVVAGRIETPKGAIEKTLTFRADAPRIDFDLLFHWPEWGKGSLRLGHITLLDEAFDLSRLSLVTHNGGAVPERFDLSGEAIEHGAPVSFLVSSSQGLGMTEGWAEIGDDKTRLRITVDRGTACLLGMLTHRISDGRLFCQLILSALELDDTRKPAPIQSGPRRFRFSLAAARPAD